MKRCLFLINPSSGQRTIQNKVDQIIGQLVLKQIVNHVDVFFTKEKDDAYHKAMETNEKDYDFFIVVGGDGTINEVISGMVNSNKKIPLAIIAAGTVNDFANYLSLPNSNVEEICQMISDFHVVCSDVGEVNDRHFINVAAGGMFSDVSFNVSKNDKKRLGPLAYYINGLIDLPSQLNTSFKLKAILDDDTIIEEDAKLFVVTNTQRVGGFDNIIPFASIQDGLLDFIIIKDCSVTDLMALSKDYLLKKHSDSPFIHYVQASKIELSCNKELVLDIDGEKGSALPLTIKAKKEAINILLPKED